MDERKAARQRELVAALHGSQQQRDEHGRFVSRNAAAGGFDGGARGGASQRRSPEQEHNELLASMAAISRTYRFGSGF